MAIKTFSIDGIGDVRIQKRRGTKHMRVRLASDGKISVSLPSWIPYAAGIEFAKHHRDWIAKNRPGERLLRSGAQIGKSHILQFERTNIVKPQARLKLGLVVVNVPMAMQLSDTLSQEAAKRGAKKALVEQADLLGKRLRLLSDAHGLPYSGVSYKFMKSKWGSCRSDKHITLNYRLLDLPVELIDYVLIHELCHTKHMNHSPDFWLLLEGILPEGQRTRKALKAVKLPW